MNWSLDNHALVAAAIAVLLVMAQVLYEVGDRYARRQQVVTTSLPPPTPKSRVLLIVGRALMGLYMVGAGWLIGGAWFRFFAGGYLLMLLASVALNVEAVMRGYLLCLPGIAAGEIRFSDEFTYKNLALQLLGSSLLMLGLYAVFGGPEFAGAALILISSAVGYWRKANIARLLPSS